MVRDEIIGFGGEFLEFFCWLVVVLVCVWCSGGGVVGFFCCWFTMDLWVVLGGGSGGVCGTMVVGWWRC